MKNREIRCLRLGLACVLLLSACRSSGKASPADDAVQVVQRWATAFDESNVDTIVSLYAPDALFFGTGSKTLVSAPEQIRSYFQAALQKDKPRGAKLLDHSVRVVSDDVVVVTGLDRVSGTKDGNVYQADGRVTFVLEKRGATWQIVHFHRSAVPTT
ncbi:MAG: SgcJ/EcaC family oxidoreductase [Deltaproteobacteria bacterium]